MVGYYNDYKITKSVFMLESSGSFFGTRVLDICMFKLLATQNVWRNKLAVV